MELDQLGGTPALSYQKIKEKNPKSFLELFDFIQKQAPQMLQQPVFIHTSGSLQPSLPLQPRVLLYGSNMTLSFSELDKTKKSVEILEFNNKTFQFSTHEIVFQKSGQVDFVDNPKACASCHGQPIKPLWEAYDFWPSAVGSFSGSSFSSQLEKSLISWVESNPHSNPVLQMINRTPVNLKKSINTFTAYLAQQNFLNSANHLKEEFSPSGKLHPFRYYILGVLSCSDKSTTAKLPSNIIYKEFLPAHIEKAWPISFDQVYQDVVQSNKTVKNFLFTHYKRRLTDAKPPESHPLGLERLRANEIAMGSQLGFLFANLGLDLKEFTLSTRRDSYILSTPNVFELDLQKTFIYFMPHILKELDYSLVQNEFLQYYKFNCEQLKEKSKKELAQYNQITSGHFISALETQPSQPAIAKCVRCHTQSQKLGDTTPIPYIPFDNTALLSEQLRDTDLLESIKERIESDDEVERMPKDSPPLTATEKAAFLEALEKLQKYIPE